MGSFSMRVVMSLEMASWGVDQKLAAYAAHAGDVDNENGPDDAVVVVVVAAAGVVVEQK